MKKTLLYDYNSNSFNFSEWSTKICRKKTLYKKFPILNWLPEYNVTKLLADIIAGLTLGLSTIPQVLGVASVAELPPEYGLYSAFVGCFIYIFFGSTKPITIGPTVTTAIITLAYTKGQPPEYSVLICFVTGVATTLMSFFQLGFIVNFISKPVISGFTSAAAISIASTQLKALLGLNFSANGFLEEIEGIMNHISEVKQSDTILAAISIFVLIFLMKIEIIVTRFWKIGPKLKKSLWFLSTSRSVLVIVLATLIYGLRGDPASVIVVGHVPPGLAPFKAPPFTYSNWNNATNTRDEFDLGSLFRNHISAVIVIPLLCLMEHITIAKAFSGSSRVDTNQEMLCIGLSNIIGSFFSSIPVTGAFGRTALNNASGAQSPLGGFITGLIVILCLEFLTPQFFYIPKASLSSVVVCAVIFMVDIDIVFSIWRTKRMDIIPWAVTFLVSLLVGLEYGILAGFGISNVFLLYYSARPGLRANKCLSLSGREFMMIELDRSVTFPSVDYIQYVVSKSASTWGNNGELSIVIECEHFQFADFTSVNGMTDLFKQFVEKKQEVILYKVKPSIVRIITQFLKTEKIPFKSCSSEADLDEILKDAVKDNNNAI